MHCDRARARRYWESMPTPAEAARGRCSRNRAAIAAELPDFRSEAAAIRLALHRRWAGLSSLSDAPGAPSRDPRAFAQLPEHLQRTRRAPSPQLLPRRACIEHRSELPLMHGRARSSGYSAHPASLSFLGRRALCRARPPALAPPGPRAPPRHLDLPSGPPTSFQRSRLCSRTPCSSPFPSSTSLLRTGTDSDPGNMNARARPIETTRAARSMARSGSFDGASSAGAWQSSHREARRAQATPPIVNALSRVAADLSIEQ